MSKINIKEKLKSINYNRLLSQVLCVCIILNTILSCLTFGFVVHIHNEHTIAETDILSTEPTEVTETTEVTEDVESAETTEPVEVTEPTEVTEGTDSKEEPKEEPTEATTPKETTPKETTPKETTPKETTKEPITTGPKTNLNFVPTGDEYQDTLELLALVIYQEAGGSMHCDECRRMVADVALNRVADDRFPNTLAGVLTQKAQYGRLYWTGLVWPSRAKKAAESTALSRAYRIAEEVLNGQHSDLYGKGYIWQAEFKQGKDNIYHCGHYFGR